MEIDKNYGNNYGENKDAIGKVTGFFLFRHLINGYNKAKEMPEDERKEIKKYGNLSIILAIVGFLISGSCLLSTIMNYEFLGFSYVLMLLVYIIGGFILSLILSIYSFVFAIMQVRLNRKASGIIGLVFSVITGITSFVLIILIFL